MHCYNFVTLILIIRKRNNLMRFVSFLMIFILSNSCIHSLSAAILKGKITAKDGFPLSHATVIVVGKNIGTTANEDGVYRLNVPTGKLQVTCQYIGFKSETVEVNIEAAETTLDFSLELENLNLEDAVIAVKTKDRAYYIMEKVIEKRKFHADLIQTLQSDIYLKGALSTRKIPDNILGIKLNAEDLEAMKKDNGLDTAGKGIIYLVEQFTQYYHKKPNQYYNKVMSVRESGDPKGVGFATMPPVINIYENNINILQGLNDRGFISPANANAFHFYKFKYIGSMMDGDYKVHKIQVVPKRKFEPLFQGYVYVVEDEWLFQSIELMLTKESQMDMLDTLHFEQYFRPVEKDLWVIQSQIIYPVLSFAGIEAAGNFITSYQNTKVNQQIPDSIFANKIIAHYDNNALNKEKDYWDSLRPIPLSKEEIKNFKVKDSLYVSNKEKEDSLKKHQKKYDLKWTTFLYGEPFIRKGTNTFTVASILNSISYNTVEGINATLKLNWNKNISEEKLFQARLFTRYGFGNNHFNPLLRLRYTNNDKMWKGKSWQWQLQGGQYVYQLNNDNPISPLMNMAYSLIGGYNYMKLYENKHVKLQTLRRWGNGWSARASVSLEERLPLINTTFYTFSKVDEINLTPNNPFTLPYFEQHRAALASLSIAYQPGWKYIQYPEFTSPIRSKAPTFRAGYTKGFAGILGSKSNFDKWNFSITHSVKLRLLGTLDYRLETGGFLQKNYVGIPDMKHIFGNQTIVANPYLRSFQLAPYYRFSNVADIYLQAHAEWHLSGLLTNKIPFFRRLNWHLVGGSNLLYINRNDYYAEVFVGLENIGYKLLRFGRVDFVAGYISGFAKPNIGVRFTIGEDLLRLLNIHGSAD